MMDLRKILIIFIVAVLFTTLTFSVTWMINPSPKYDDYCRYSADYAKPMAVPAPQVNCTKIIEPSETEGKNCTDSHGYVEYTYDGSGCATKWKCNTCQYYFDEATKEHDYVLFLVASIMGVMAIALGLYMPISKNAVNQWLSTGFMLGGLISLFTGTVIYFPELGRFVRPVVIFIELVIVVYIAYKKIEK
jgi:hypothetical protein